MENQTEITTVLVVRVRYQRGSVLKSPTVMVCIFAVGAVVCGVFDPIIAQVFSALVLLAFGLFGWMVYRLNADGRADLLTPLETDDTCPVESPAAGERLMDKLIESRRGR